MNHIGLVLCVLLHPENEFDFPSVGFQCAGNRRTAMSKTKTVKGVGWGVSAIGNG